MYGAWCMDIDRPWSLSIYVKLNLKRAKQKPQKAIGLSGLMGPPLHNENC
jgi:hypothetical protein